ncbi:MAG: hypothetical protein A2655_04765 [Candidatus Yanofskybacteria bacterium RIFCSPHIGHO2_01_FULL_43_42]|uniref:Uncharacterized protein n=1 Tax=Candidatus Yanofskybacteria bacterium RIFCSPLOWO2_01_FULL_43_22 TaxID=1802695 RepID=A0A1F8GJV9_9BACT|nr:MAG: hypothetical protein A2655_04765 [Candidatus Yanofskybacteria bacterium RIFCSPHIGHO2_01_FULL_43_42]OGN13842.1 MAG: hypothetical protein A3D48_04105 [Candidatus Yanofskybacteria bacterium RIFCSPHIGHO2_02_FULL_43_17]OGN25290.1 MAG: hypothetical protein A3A13_00360 [Candidatus Yanofskybacteria bacterium RIFCSPLOWO2_01_FULL_43_22]
MGNYKASFDVIGRNDLSVKIWKGKKPICGGILTIGQDFDIVLIRTLDKILRSNKIERLSLKSVEISGKMASSALSGMILRSVAKALEV